MTVFIHVRMNNRVKMNSSTYDVRWWHTVFCSLSLFYFSISNVLCRLRKKKTHTHLSSLCTATQQSLYICEYSPSSSLYL